MCKSVTMGKFVCLVVNACDATHRLHVMLSIGYLFSDLNTSSQKELRHIQLAPNVATFLRYNIQSHEVK
jgi:hypothetical protein